MDKFYTLSEMMMTPGNAAVWEVYIKENFLPKQEGSNLEDIISYLQSERSLIMDEVAWSDNEKVKRLSICIKSKLKKI